MIEKEKLVRLLGKCLAMEEQSIPLYGRHSGDPEFLSDLKPVEQEDVRELLLRLARESEFQAQTYRDLIKAIEGSGQNVF